MNLLDFKGKAAAEAWKADLAELNAQTDAVMSDVRFCIEEIKDESEGQFVTELITTAADLAAATADMIEALDNLKDVVNSILGKIAEIVGEVVQEVVTKREAATDLSL